MDPDFRQDYVWGWCAAPPSFLASGVADGFGDFGDGDPFGLVVGGEGEAAGGPVCLGLPDAAAREETKFHQTWRGPSSGAPPQSMTRAPGVERKVAAMPGRST